MLVLHFCRLLGFQTPVHSAKRVRSLCAIAVRARYAAPLQSSRFIYSFLPPCDHGRSYTCTNATCNNVWRGVSSSRGSTFSAPRLSLRYLVDMCVLFGSTLHGFTSHPIVRKSLHLHIRTSIRLRPNRRNTLIHEVIPFQSACFL